MDKILNDIFDEMCMVYLINCLKMYFDMYLYLVDDSNPPMVATHYKHFHMLMHTLNLSRSYAISLHNLMN